MIHKILKCLVIYCLTRKHNFAGLVLFRLSTHDIIRHSTTPSGKGKKRENVLSIIPEHNSYDEKASSYSYRKHVYILFASFT